MAKRKKSTALFEVMQSSRQARTGETGTPGRAPKVTIPTSHRSYAPPPGQLAKPVGPPSFIEAGKKWFADWAEKRQQRRHAAAAAALAARAEAATEEDHADAHDPTAGVTAQSLLTRRRSAESSVDSHGVAALAPAASHDYAADARAEQASADEYVEPTESVPPASSRPVTYTTTLATYGRSTQPAPEPTPKNKVAIDRDRHEVLLKVRFTTAAICVTAVLVVVGTAYILGKRAAGPNPNAAKPRPATQPANDVLAPAPRNVRPKTPAGDATVAGNKQGAPGRDTITSINPSAGGGTETTLSSAAVVDATLSPDRRTAQRTPGLNYMVIMQYAPAKLEWAEEVAAYLNDNGFPCTIEIGSSETITNDGWYVLTGTRGFAASVLRSNSPEYTRYVDALNKLAENYPAKHKFSRPQPFMRKER